MTRRELIRLRRGDPELFRELVETHSPRLLTMASSFADDMDEAHDLVQETWIRAFDRRSTFQGRGTVLGWLLAVCRSVCLSAARRRAPIRLEEAAERAVASTFETPDSAVERAEIGRSIRRALLELPDREREIAMARLVEGLSTRETARLLGIAEGTVKAGLHHATQKLGENLQALAPSDAAAGRGARTTTGRTTSG